MEPMKQTLDGPRWAPPSGQAPRQLVVLCHGVGADGNDLIDLAPTWSAALPNAAFVAPHAPQPYDAGPTGRQWYSIGDRNPARMEAGVRQAAEVLGAFIVAELAALGLPPQAYALVGFSQGAMTALFTGLRSMPPPRAIVAYAGALLGGASLAAELVRPPPPVLLAHGDADDVVPISRSRDAERVLTAAGVAVETLWCRDLGHGIDAAGLSLGGLFLQRGFADG
jgi:phospholipase/carboxylesterase